ncbi:MAG: PAS domain-containing protein [Chthoniobacter sp.]|nr:PAS domain-containing protein [Chthoniobacter sp.]
MSASPRLPRPKPASRKTARTRPAPAKSRPRQPVPCPIVGIGASAGGLEAFTQLLAALPAHTGLALVLVQHLDPAHASRLTELLARATRRPVHEICEGMSVEPDHVYVIPPNSDLSILHGRLSLTPRTKARGLHLPVDTFFRALAADQQRHAIGVILSGTASDGTEGLRAIKAAGGLTFAQEEKSAQHDGMPRSAIAAGVVDRVLPPEGIARELARVGRHPYVVQSAAAEDPLPDSGDDMRKIFILLRAASGVDFSFYKPTTLKRRIARRMTLQKVDSLAHYVRFLRQTPGEVAALFDDMLINVTSFFREPDTFTALQKDVFPRLLADRSPETPLRVWVPGCSTGEEAYSLAIALLEFLGESSTPVPVQIFASDVSEPAIEKARAGLYPPDIAADVSPARLRRFFTPHSGGYQIRKAVRDLCVFARQDVVKDPPFSRLDLVSCRNLLIYFGPVLQKRVIPTFHYALRPGGFLLLGNSETTGDFADLFALADHHHKIYARKPATRRLPLELPFTHQPEQIADASHALPVAHATGFDFQKEADRIVLGRYTPAGVIVNKRLDVLQFRGRTGPYLEPSPGAASLNLLKMAREGLLVELRAALTEARRRHAPAVRRGVQVKAEDGFREVSVEVIPLPATPDDPADCYLVLFAESPPAATKPQQPPGKTARARDKVVEQLQQELLATKEYLQSVLGEHERGHEELQSANEEILSSNEELQSTNEEMETAKEELQSTNEELTTVNDELQTRNAELSQANGDLVNLLNSVQVPIVILGGDLRIRRFTPLAERVLNLIPGDVGRPLSDLRPSLRGPDLEKLIVGVMDSLVPQEVEVQDRAGRAQLLRIRPYQTLENKIDGVILTLVDIRGTVAQELASAIVDTVRQPLLVLDGELRVQVANAAFYTLFRVRPEDTEQRLIYMLGRTQWDIPQLRRLLEEILPQGAPVEGFVVDAEFPGVGWKKLVLNACRLVGGSTDEPRILLAIEEADRP